MRLLIVEDEIGLAEGIKAVLEKNNYLIDMVHDGISGLDYAESGLYDLIILDIMLPGMSGLQILSALRGKSMETPVLLLTAKSDIEDKIEGLDCGADDYLTKPFDTGELLARIRAHTRRKSEYVTEDMSFGDLVLKRKTLELCCGSQSIKLGSKEFSLIECLMLNQNQIVPKDLLCEKVWGPDDNSEYNNVEVYISFLRKKLSHLSSFVQIKATRNIGYSLEGEKI